MNEEQGCIFADCSSHGKLEHYVIT